jgi:hypothetical protein
MILTIVIRKPAHVRYIREIVIGTLKRAEKRNPAKHESGTTTTMVVTQ